MKLIINKELFESSIILRHLKNISQGYLSIEEKINFIHSDSFIYRLTKKRVAELIKIVKFSFFGRLVKIDLYVFKNSFETGKITKAILNWKGRFKNKLIDSYSTSSVLLTSIKSLKCDFFLQPLKIGGIIVSIAVTTNSVLAVILQRQITTLGWAIRGLFLFSGIIGLFCGADLQGIKQTSFVLKILKK